MLPGHPAMPTSSRIVLPGVPLHITQRGVDRGPTFLAPEDHAHFRWLLRHAAARAGCRVHAYVLMDNHVHLLVTPSDAGAAARMMRSLGRRYVRYFNDRYRRTGTLWEGRFRSVVIDSVQYYLACTRYIELNPVRAAMVTDPRQYPWSSFRHNALGQLDPVIASSAVYDDLGVDRASRCAAYRDLFRVALAPDELAGIRAPLLGRPKLYSTAYRDLVASAAVAGRPTAAPRASTIHSDGPQC
jgi:putative transposase